LHTTQHRIVLIIFPVILLTSIIAQMMSAGGYGFGIKVKVKASHTQYQALGPELIPVYRQSARKSCTWL